MSGTAWGTEEALGKGQRGDLNDPSLVMGLVRAVKRDPSPSATLTFQSRSRVDSESGPVSHYPRRGRVPGHRPSPSEQGPGPRLRLGDATPGPWGSVQQHIND